MKEEGGGASRTTDLAAGSSTATDVSLREYLSAAINESRRECRDNIAHLEKHFDEIQSHNEETLIAFRGEVSRRFDGVNEFRDALSDLSALMATKDNLSRVEEKFATLAQGISDRVTQLERRADQGEGKEVGSKVTWGNVVAIIAATGTLLGIIVVTATYLSTH